MKPGRTRGWFSRSMAALLSAAVFASSFGPGTAALAADVRVGAASDARVHDGGASAVSPLSLVPSIAPSAFAPLTAPALSAVLPELGGHARPVAAALPARLVPAAAPAVSAAPALSAAPAAASSPLGRLGEWFSRVSGREAAPAPADGGAQPSADESKEQAEVEFRRLTGEAAGPARGALDAAPVAGAESALSGAPVLAPAKRFGGLAAAESRVRSGGKSRAEHLRLLRASVDLRGSGARWTFAYHAPAKKQILTYGPQGVESRKLGHAEKPVMIAREALAGADVDRDWAALKAARPDFKAVRAEVLPRATGGTVTVFYDARGRSAKAPAA
ncbi:MAG: hypothetical protein HY079_14620, partial [Elusimicrobia bacterium]|nr:hypothetical protein [Elusimicrobiota bacterium]